MTDATPTPYTDLPGLADLLLEESWVLDIAAHPGRITLRAELVLTPEHPEYAPPGPQEQFCTRFGTLTLPEVVTLTWTGQGARPIVDPDGSIDYGNIDVFVRSGRTTRIDGEFGSLLVESDAPKVELDPLPASPGN
ncbi:hypothetical protein [Actinocatenispora rupis]|uniref:Uncharacterized protein n=1 Tax=Actinocatenispora rupis TaxID=519421 RepID=A0A8J3NDC3_9ACTN|nr:hypothetical protein [Actinocatenispora rupis]GID14916.1 hypothetical protein Aru02nite_58050 [Actinocatenispora rupis]